ncbi:sensor histidine kinase [Neptuniibacter sp. QD48_55]|uniref:sensor histidine kinase n=1 Tax=Neptuniibacter sp. QD48_55 TaxID=3398212 RepID=UPI0039F4E228
MTRVISLEQRIRNRLLLVVLPLLMVLVFIIDRSVHILVDDLVVSRLKQDAESLITSIDKKNAAWQVDEKYLPTVYQRVRSGHYFILSWNKEQIRSRSLWDTVIDVSEFSSGDTEEYQYFENAGERWLVYQETFTKKGQTFSLWVAEDITLIEQKQRFYEWILVAVAGLSIFGFVLWQRYVIRTGFNRLAPVQEAIENNKNTGELSFPKDVPQEISGLVESIRKLVSGSEEQLSRSRMALGNLAHELKKPLQELKIHASMLTDTAQRKAIEKSIEQLHRRIDSELRRARISGAPMPGYLFSFAEELLHLEVLLNQIHDRKLALSVNSEHDKLPFDRDDMLELLGNLLDNAWKYSQSEVRITVETDGNYWFFYIDDDGEGISESKIEQANKRGVRVDENEHLPGHGLGLSICESIARVYGGSLTLSASELGGLRVKVELVKKL